MPIAKKKNNTKRTTATNRAATTRKTATTKAVPKKASANTTTARKQATQKGNLKDLRGTPYINLLVLPFEWFPLSELVGTSEHPKSKRRAVSNQLTHPEIKQCLVTRKFDTEATIQPCYLLNEHHWRNNKWLARLEWWWGMKYDSLELNTESNRLYLRQDWLQSFQSGQWILLPTYDILDKISSHYGIHSSLPKDADKPPLEDVYGGAETFEYRLVPLHSSLPFIRTGRPIGLTSRSKPTHGRDRVPSHHSYPFDTLPTLISRVKPHFVICDAGQKLAHTLRSAMPPIVASIYGIDEILAQGMLNMVLESYMLWGSQRPPPRFASSPRTPPRMPVTTMASVTPVSCDGPCFYNRYEWSVHRCDQCKASSHLCRFRPVGSTDLDTCNEFLSHDGTDGGEDSPQYKVYRQGLIRHVGKWLSACSHQVEKRGWTSWVSNDGQLGDYAHDRPRKRQRLK